MKDKFKLLLLFALLSGLSIKAQLFENRVFPSSSTNGGDIVLQDLIVGQYVDTTDLISTGSYNYNQDSASATLRAVLVSNDFTSTRNFAKSYAVFDATSKAFNTSCYGVVEYSSGYIMAGNVTDNAFHGSEAINGGDIVLIKCNSSGSVVSSKIVDLGGNDIAYAIKPLGTSNTNFVVCGTSSSSFDKAHAFVMKIDNNLNVSWMTKFDLRSTGSIPTYSVLNDVVSDGTTVWAVGSVRDSATLNSDGLVVKLSSSGTYLLSRHVYNGLDREILNHVEIDGSDLVITGQSKPRSLFITQRMIVFKYNTSSNTISNIYWLKSSAAGDIGYDISPAVINGTKNYYVVGKTVPSSGVSKGVFYKLNSSFQPVVHREYSSAVNKEIYALGIRNSGSSSFLSMAGYVDGIDSDGYILKTDLSGRTSCEDSLGVDSTSLQLNLDTLLFSVDTAKTLYTPTVFVDTLLDSLICEDTTSGLKSIAANIENLTFTEAIKLFPNPVGFGQHLNVLISKEHRVREIVVYDIYGRRVSALIKPLAENEYNINMKTLTSGVYIIHVEFFISSSNEVQYEDFRVVVE